MINKLIFQGRLTADPELKQTPSGVEALEFSVAWSEKYKEVETKCFMRCKAWRHTAKFISEYFRKGQEICIDGYIVTEEWQKDGEKRSRTICTVEKAHFCGSKSSRGESKPDENGFASIPDGTEEELPFN